MPVEQRSLSKEIQEGFNKLAENRVESDVYYNTETTITLTLSQLHSIALIMDRSGQRFEDVLNNAINMYYQNS